MKFSSFTGKMRLGGRIRTETRSGQADVPLRTCPGLSSCRAVTSSSSHALGSGTIWPGDGWQQTYLPSLDNSVAQTSGGFLKASLEGRIGSRKHQLGQADLKEQATVIRAPGGAAYTKSSWSLNSVPATYTSQRKGQVTVTRVQGCHRMHKCEAGIEREPLQGQSVKLTCTTCFPKENCVSNLRLKKKKTKNTSLVK